MQKETKKRKFFLLFLLIFSLFLWNHSKVFAASLSYTLNHRDPTVTIPEEKKEEVINQVLQNWPKSLIEDNWNYVHDQAVNQGWNPAFVIALWIEESGASGVPAYDLGCLGGEANNIESQLNCLFNLSYRNAPFEEFMCIYSDGKAPCDFSVNPNFPGNLGYWYFKITGEENAPLPVRQPSFQVNTNPQSIVDCVGEGLAGYVANVFKSLGITSFQNSFGNVRFLSPVFNMTNPHFPALAEKFNQELNRQGYSFQNFYAVAGNAYNTSWGKISDFVSKARSTSIGQKSIILTEIGWYPHNTSDRAAALNQLKEEIFLFDQENVIGGLIFNVFGNNPEFAAQQMSNEEISYACNNNCSASKIGANFASYYPSSETFYQRAQGNQMKYILAIAPNDINAVIQGINLAQKYGLTPIIRIGTRSGSGGFDSPQDLAEFIKKINNAVSFPVYIVVGSNEPLTETWTTPNCQYSTKPITLSGASDVCSAFTVERKSPMGKFAGETEGTFKKKEDIGDQIITKKNLMPDFSRAQMITKKALASLLPQEMLTTLSLPASGNIYLTHFAYGEKKRENPARANQKDQYPKEKIILPPHWPQLAGAARGLYSVLTPSGKDPQAPLSHFRFQLEDTGFLESTNLSHSCQPGMGAKDSRLPEAKHIEKDLSLKNILVTIISHLTSWFDEYGNFITGVEKEKETKFKVLTLGKLPAGEKTTNETVALAKENLPQDYLEKMKNPHDEAKALQTSFDYEIKNGGGGPKPASYFGLNKWRAHYCLGVLCSTLPAGKSVSSNDPICPSCKAKDYKKPLTPIPPPKNLPRYCVWDQWVGACDYYDIHGHEGCDGDPVCEGGRCNPLEYSFAKDYINNGCPVPYADNDKPSTCVNSAVCVKKKFAPNSKGGYGPCHYKNPVVCVRADVDHNNTDNCAAVCNWGCCEYQE